MLTLYAPAAGTVRAATAGTVGVALEVPADASGTINAPTRGRVVDASPTGLRLVDLRERRVDVLVEAPEGVRLDALAAEGEEVGFDAPLFRWSAVPGASLLVSLTVPAGSDVLPHAAIDSSVAAGADLLSVGPFSCGA